MATSVRPRAQHQVSELYLLTCRQDTTSKVGELTGAVFIGDSAERQSNINTAWYEFLTQAVQV